MDYDARFQALEDKIQLQDKKLIRQSAYDLNDGE
jgi:hypothetical protein